MPELSFEAQALIRVGYGALWLGTLITLLPNLKLFFLTEKFGGYCETNGLAARIQSPPLFYFIGLAWVVAIGLLVAGLWILPAAAFNLILCHHFFIRQRWSSLLRGMGAPGFMTWWLAVAVFILELTSHYAPQWRSLGLLALQVDFAIIMFSAGFYKLTAGYPAGIGMELGMVNPMWGYWTGFFRRLPSDHWVFFVLNQLAWATEIFGSILMLFPQTRLWGGLAIAGSFAFVMTQIRLNLLCEMVILSCVLFIPAGHIVDQWLGLLVQVTAPVPEPLAVLNLILPPIFLSYIILRPIALAGLYYNFYLKKSFPRPVQKALELYCNWFGIILWRVFTKEVTDFLIRIETQENGHWRLLSDYPSPKNWRFNNVAEAIAVATIFTSIKYFAGNPEIFRQRLLRYSRTLPGCEMRRFQYVAIRKQHGRFVEIPVMEFMVNPVQETVTETILDANTASELNLATYAAQECVRPGSYVTARNV